MNSKMSDNSDIILDDGELQLIGDVRLTQEADGEERIVLETSNGNLWLGGNGPDGDAVLLDGTGSHRIHLDAANGPVADSVRVYLDGRHGNITLGGDGADGDLLLEDGDGERTIHLDAQVGNVTLGGHDTDGDIVLRDKDGERTVHLDAQVGNATLGGNDTDGDLLVRDEDNRTRIHLDGSRGPVGGSVRVYLDGGEATVRIGGDGEDGDLEITDSDGLVRTHMTCSDEPAGNDVRYAVNADDGSVRVGGAGTDGNLDIADVLGDARIRIGDYRTSDDLSASVDDPKTRARLTTRAQFELGGDDEDGSISLTNGDDTETVALAGATGRLTLGDTDAGGNTGRLVIRDEFGEKGVDIDGDFAGVGAPDPDSYRPNHPIELDGADSILDLKDGAWNRRVRVHGGLGQIILSDDQGTDTVTIDGDGGDISVGTISSLIGTIEDLQQRVDTLETDLADLQNGGS